MDLAAIAARPAVARARDMIHETDDETLADLVRIAEIPAPPFLEQRRAAHMHERFARIGLDEVALDEAGNVLALLPGHVANGAAPVLLSAHLDTVFPEGTDVRVRREGERLMAPGIADDARGLAAILAIARTLRRAGVATNAPLVFAATVGEEGAGDLRGVKHLFREGAPWRRCAAFISLDGAGCRRIVHRAVASRRLRVTINGPGGHSWADFGVPNPIHALGAAIGALARLAPSRRPRTALTVARTAGGTGVNVIPDQAWLELDLRSEDDDVLRALELEARHAIRAAAGEINARRRRGTPALSMSIDVIGDRPGGETPPGSPLVRSARAATHRISAMPELVASSTDANVPIALGIPAIAMGAGGEAGGTHTQDEWYSNEMGAEGIERALLTVLAMTGAA